MLPFSTSLQRRQPRRCGKSSRSRRTGAPSRCRDRLAGAKWETARYGAPRWFQYWSAADLDALLGGSGFEVVESWSNWTRGPIGWCGTPCRTLRLRPAYNDPVTHEGWLQTLAEVAVALAALRPARRSSSPKRTGVPDQRHPPSDHHRDLAAVALRCFRLFSTASAWARLRSNLGAGVPGRADPARYHRGISAVSSRVRCVASQPADERDLARFGDLAGVVRLWHAPRGSLARSSRLCISWRWRAASPSGRSTSSDSRSAWTANRPTRAGRRPTGLTRGGSEPVDAGRPTRRPLLHPSAHGRHGKPTFGRMG